MGRAAGAPIWALSAALVAGFGAASGAWADRALSEVETTVTRVIDGDTFEVAGGEKVRVRNFDTPELRSYDCAAEKQLAQDARDAAREILADAPVRLAVTDRDRYGRLVADVALTRPSGDVDFAQAMIESGHGARWNYGVEPQPTWCGPEHRRAAEAAARAQAEAEAERERDELILDIAVWALRTLF